MADTILAVPSTAPAQTDPATEQKPVAPALGLGWQVSSLYRRARNLDPRSAATTDHLGGVSALSHLDRFTMELDSIEFHLLKVSAHVTWNDQVPEPSTEKLRAVLATAAEQVKKVPADYKAAEGAVREAVAQFHADLLSRLTAADPLLGRAYGLGRALADTCRPGQKAEDLKQSFDEHRLGQLSAWLSDLASVLPPHSAKAVRLSLTWWRDYAFATKLVSDENELLSGVTSSAPGLLPPAKRAMRRAEAKGKRPPTVSLADAASRKAMDERAKFLPALGRQGEVWRSVLTGERDATHVLTADDFVEAAQRTVHSAWQIARSLPRSIWVAAAAVLAVVAASSAAILWASSATPGAKIGGVLGFVVAGLVSLGRLATAAGRQLRPIIAKLEAPLWDAEMDQVIAAAITRPPVGPPDRTGWAGFVDLTVPKVATELVAAGAPEAGADGDRASTTGAPA